MATLEELEALAKDQQAKQYGYSAPTIEREARPEPVFVAQPNVGTDFTWVVPGEYSFFPEMVKFSFAASATVINRTKAIEIRTADNALVGTWNDAANQAANTTNVIAFQHRFGANIQGSSVSNVPMTGFILRPGWKIKSAIIALQVGDQISGVVIVGSRYSTGIDAALDRESFEGTG